jgi:type II secretory pathway component PulF
MALYAYQAFSKDGKKIQGLLDAPSVEIVKEQLANRGLFPITVQLAPQGARAGFFTRLFGMRITTKNKVLFTNQLAILLKAGVPLLQALELLADQVEGSLRNITIAIKDDVKEGSSFANALSKYPKIFPNLYIQLVRAGESSGNLEPILTRLSDYLERSDAIRKKISGALQYPIIQLCAALIVVVGMINFVVPNIAQALAGQDQELPMLTKTMVAIADFISGYYLVLIIGLIIIVALYKYWASTSQGGIMLDRIKLYIPLVKHITKTNAVVQFSYTLGMLLEGGVNLAEALDIVCAVIDNKILTDLLKKARDNIVKQGKIAQYLQQTNVFPPIAIYLIKTGEETGQLDAMLLTVARNFEQDLNELIDKLTAAIAPIMLVVVGGLVGLIILSIMQPIFSMMNNMPT